MDMVVGPSPEGSHQAGGALCARNRAVHKSSHPICKNMLGSEQNSTSKQYSIVTAATTAL